MRSGLGLSAEGRLSASWELIRWTSVFAHFVFPVCGAGTQHRALQDRKWLCHRATHRAARVSIPAQQVSYKLMELFNYFCFVKYDYKCFVDYFMFLHYGFSDRDKSANNS